MKGEGAGDGISEHSVNSSTVLIEGCDRKGMRRALQVRVSSYDIDEL